MGTRYGKYQLPTIVTSGLVLNLDASNATSYPGSGTIWYDLSGVIGNINIQSRSTDWTFQTDPATGLKAIYNASNRFDTQSPGINFPTNNGFNKAAGTVDFWIKPVGDLVGGHGYFVNSDGSDYTNATNWIWFGTWDTSGAMYFRQGNPTTCCNDVSLGGWSTNYYYLNSWVNLSCTWNVAAARATVYKNGEIVAQRTNMPTDIPNTNPTTTGQLFNGHERGDNMQFKGYCNNYRIYNRELTTAEIQTNFKALKSRFNS